VWVGSLELPRSGELGMIRDLGSRGQTQAYVFLKGVQILSHPPNTKPKNQFAASGGV